MFEEATNSQAFAKLAFIGFEGSGKTTTAAKLAIGLHRYLQAQGRSVGKINFLDSETGSDWLIPRFKAAGLTLNVHKTRAFKALVPAIQATEEDGGILIIDSLTHFWRELVDSYAAANNRQRGLVFSDWATVKGIWGGFTGLYVNSQAHVILCGRAGYEYDFFESDNGKKELEKTGIKMKAEGETGYEPNLLVLMERQQDITASPVRTWRTATILKDRSTILDGKQFTDPDFDDFLPHIEFLNLGGQHLGYSSERTELPGFDKESAACRILLDEIKSLLVKHHPANDAKSRQAKLELLDKCFGTTSWPKLETYLYGDLKSGFSTLRKALGA